MRKQTACVQFATLLLIATLTACGDNRDTAPSQLTGQVRLASSATLATTHFAASRFLEQASMGPSPNSVARVRELGIEGWIDAQFRLPASTITTPENLISYDQNLDKPTQDRAWNTFRYNVENLFWTTEDQLRVRTTWVLSNFLIVSTAKVEAYGVAEYLNTLQNRAFGKYGDLLKAITKSPAMGRYLDNQQNSKFSLNENYARELMQLFSVGLVELNIDGSVKRDANNKPIETYSQADVVTATKMLTGWDYSPRVSSLRSDSNYANFGYPMVARNDWHVTDEKHIYGAIIPASQTVEEDLDSLIDILVRHPNTAPFVAIRLIQGMTTSDPSPAYITRVAGVFKSTQGDLQKVIKAVLMDPEARAGDLPGGSPHGFGRIKEPYLVGTSVLRALECKQAGNPNATLTASYVQQALRAPSVFGFYPPNHRAPSSKLLAPEQKMLTATEFSSRAGHWSWTLQNSEQNEMSDAGCNLTLFADAAAASDAEILALLNQRLFRGVMPATVGQALVQATQNNSSSLRRVGEMIEMALLTPAFGVSK
jgi:uncharacterized protein (DUF1800 family)